MSKKNFREAFIYLVEKHKKDNNIVGDFCRDSLDFQYKEEMEDPCRFMEFVAHNCNACDEAVEAMDIIRRKYNIIVDNPLMRILYDTDWGDGCDRKHYIYKWEKDAFDTRKHNSDECKEICKEMCDYMDSIPHKYFYNTLLNDRN